MARNIDVKIQFDSNGKAVFASLRGDADELSKSLSGLQGQVKSFGKSLEPTYNTLAGLGFIIQNSVSGLRDFSASYIDLDKAMRKANTMAGKSGDEYSKLKESIKDMSSVIPLAREELANGLYQVVSNGVPEDNWISFLEQSAKSAVGGLADLGQVVNVTSTLIKNYGLEWDAVTEIQDKIQMTAKNGVTSFEQLASALPELICVLFFHFVVSGSYTNASARYRVFQ